MTATMNHWRNWSGAVEASPQALSKPQTTDELSDIIRNTPGPIRVAGSGHSFTPLVASSGTIIDLAAFDKLIDHDPDQQLATIGAGTKLCNLIHMLKAVGQALPNMGDIDAQAIGGALGTATHGTGPELGAYHTQLRMMKFIDGRGDERCFTEDRDADMIRATGVTLGAFGVLTEVTMKNTTGYKLHRRRSVMPLGDILAGFDDFMNGYRTAEFFIVPYSSHVILQASDISDAPATNRPPESDEEGIATLRLARNLLQWLPWARRKLIGNALAKLPVENYVEEWLNVYTSDRATRFNEMEYHLPFEEGPKAIAEIVELTEKQFPQVYFPMEVRAVAADDFWLSPFYQRKTCSIAIHHDAKEDSTAFFKAAEPIFKRYGGRPHWGKMHNLTARDFETLYPRWKDAMEVRREIDPDNRFISPYLAKLLGV